MRPSPLFWETDPQEWCRYFHTNLYGVMNCCHAALPGMGRLGRGRIVTIVSDAGRLGESRLAAYSAPQAGATDFVRSIAQDEGRLGTPSHPSSLSPTEPPLPPHPPPAFLDPRRPTTHPLLH